MTAQTQDELTRRTPLLDRLLTARSQERAALHMPGHDHGAGFAELAAELAALDTTELDISDDLHDPGPALREAQALWAAAAGASQSTILTGGSSLGIKAALLAAAGRRGRVLLEPWAHVASYYACEIGELLPLFLTGTGRQASDFDPLPTVDLPELTEFLQRLPEDELPAALLVTSPDFYGGLAPVRELAALCHQHGIILVVDEAHGAHFNFLDHYDSALSQGADIVIQSAHKTLPALTPAALLHLSKEGEERLGEARLRELHRWLLRLDTTSPSLLIAATADYARAWMEERGISAAAAIRFAWQQLSEDPSLQKSGLRFSSAEPSTARDVLRCVIDCAESGFSADHLTAELASDGIFIEMHDWRRLVLIPSMPAGSEAIRFLQSKLPAACRRAREGRLAPETADRLDRLLLAAYRERLLPTRQRKGTDYWLPLEQAQHAISSQLLLPYPPGLPLFWPGERMTRSKLTLLSTYGEINGRWPQGVVVRDGRAGVLCQEE